MAKRKIVHIDEDKCNGCGQCILQCHEGAIRIINGKAKLVSEKYCDGLGNCLGTCPQDAITIVERDADTFDFEKTNMHLKKAGREILKENPVERKITKTKQMMACGCPGTMAREIKRESASVSKNVSSDSRLTQWPVQLRLINPDADYFKGCDLLIAADCVPFSYAGFHPDLLDGKKVAIFCPKLDTDTETYIEKITEIIVNNKIKSITVATMEVPCCFGAMKITQEAVARSGNNLNVRNIIISIDGKIKR